MQKGSDLTGILPWERLGYHICMPDSNTVAVSSPFASAPGQGAVGKVQVIGWIGSGWLPKGSPVFGIVQDGTFGYALSMPDSNTIAVGTPWSDLTVPFSANAKVFVWNGSNWVLKGAPLVTTHYLTFFGNAVSMPDANTLAVGNPGYGTSV